MPHTDGLKILLIKKKKKTFLAQLLQISPPRRNFCQVCYQLKKKNFAVLIFQLDIFPSYNEIQGFGFFPYYRHTCARTHIHCPFTFFWLSLCLQFCLKQLKFTLFIIFVYGSR